MGKEVIEKVADLIMAFGLVAALAWNEAIQSWFAGQETLSAGGQWVYAILVTIIAVAAAIWVGRMSERAAGE